jgi:hypothetical protein
MSEYAEKISLEIKSCFKEEKIKSGYFVVKVVIDPLPTKVYNKKLIDHLQKICSLIYISNSNKIYLCFKKTSSATFEWLDTSFYLHSPQKICSIIACYIASFCPKTVVLCRVCPLKESVISLYTFLYDRVLDSYKRYLNSKDIDNSLTEYELHSVNAVQETKEIFGVFYKNCKEIVRGIDSFKFETNDLLI